MEIFAHHHHRAARVARNALGDAPHNEALHPIIFGQLIGTGNVTNLFIAYLLSAGLMIFAAVIELVLGVRAEGQSLENVARPLTAIEEATGTSAVARS